MLSIFLVSAVCGSEISNNITYFTNPRFPGLINEIGECTIAIKKSAFDISQIRLDFIHFNLVSEIAKLIEY